jgi:WD40 repeat protein
LRQALGASHLRQIISHTGAAVTSAAFSPDGRHIAAASDDGTVTVYDSDTGELVRAARPVSAPSNNFGSPAVFTADGQAVVFSTTSGKAYVWRWRSGSDPTMLQTSNISATTVAPRRDLFATGDDSGRIQLWNSQGEQRGTLFGLPVDSHVNALAFTPDGATLASGSDWNLSLWNMRPSVPKLALRHDGTAQSVAFSSDGKSVAAAGNGKVGLWAATAGGRWRPQKFGDVDQIAGSLVKFSSTGGRLAIVRGNVAEVWNARNGRRLVELNGHSDSILDIAFSRDGNQIVTAAADATGRVWEGLNGGTLLQLRGHAGAVYDASFSPDGNRVLTAGADGTVRTWDVAAGRVLTRHYAEVRSAAFGPMGETVVTASRDTTSCFVRNLSSGACRLVAKRRGAVMDARISSSGSDILTAHSDGTVSVWSTALKREVARLTRSGLPIESAAFSSDGQLIAVGNGSHVYEWRWKENPARVLEATTDVLIRDAILDVQFGPGRYDNLILTAHADGTARLWDSRRVKVVRRFSEPGADVTYEAKFSPMGDRVVTANGDGIARVWDTASGRRLQELRSVSRRPLTSVNFSPDGAWVVAGDTEGNVTIWDVASEKVLAVLPWHAGAVNSVEFKPTGDGQILSTGEDGVVRLSTCTSCGPVGSLLEAARRLPK